MRLSERLGKDIKAYLLAPSHDQVACLVILAERYGVDAMKKSTLSWAGFVGVCKDANRAEIIYTLQKAIQENSNDDRLFVLLCEQAAKIEFSVTNFHKTFDDMLDKVFNDICNGLVELETNDKLAQFFAAFKMSVMVKYNRQKAGLHIGYREILPAVIVAGANYISPFARNVFVLFANKMIDHVASMETPKRLRKISHMNKDNIAKNLTLEANKWSGTHFSVLLNQLPSAEVSTRAESAAIELVSRLESYEKLNFLGSEIKNVLDGVFNEIKKKLSPAPSGSLQHS